MKRVMKPSKKAIIARIFTPDSSPTKRRTRSRCVLTASASVSVGIARAATLKRRSMPGWLSRTSSRRLSCTMAWAWGDLTDR